MLDSLPSKVLEALEHAKIDVPSRLNEVLNIAFYASLKTEEGRTTMFTLALCGPASLTPQFPGDWDPIQFQNPRDFCIREVVKLAPAADPRRVLIGVDPAAYPLRIWGLLGTKGYDHPLGRRAYQATWYDRFQFGPAFLKICCDGPGRVSIHSRQKRLVEFRDGEFVTCPNSRLLGGGFVEKRLNALVNESLSPLLWVARLLRVIQEMRHGGTILFVPDGEPKGISLKYEGGSTAVGDGIRNLWDSSRTINQTLGPLGNQIRRNEILRDLPSHQTPLPQFDAASLLAIGGMFDFETDAIDDMKRSLRALAELSAVDGAVLVGSDFKLLGFGGKIDAPSSLPNVYRAVNPDGQNPELMDTSERGNRLISAISFCDSNPEALAFVCSQDGPVSAVLKHEENVIVWPNIETMELGPQA